MSRWALQVNPMLPICSGPFILQKTFVFVKFLHKQHHLLCLLPQSVWRNGSLQCLGLILTGLVLFFNQYESSRCHPHFLSLCFQVISPFRTVHVCCLYFSFLDISLTLLSSLLHLHLPRLDTPLRMTNILFSHNGITSYQILRFY